MRTRFQKFIRWLPLILLLYVTVTALQVVVTSRQDQAAPADAIVVLGTAQYNGRPSSVFRARLNHGIDLYEAGYAPLLIATGGQGRDPTFSEGGVGASYVVSRGVPAEAVLAEERGLSTWQSMIGVAHIAEARGIERIIVVSDPFHIARSKAMARVLGLEALGSPTQSSPISRRPSAEAAYMVREVVSLTIYRAVWLRDALWNVVV